MKHGLFTQCAVDNLEFHENTADGTTTHGTKHVFYQYGNHEPGQLASVPSTRLEKHQSALHHHQNQRKATFV